MNTSDGPQGQWPHSASSDTPGGPPPAGQGWGATPQGPAYPQQPNAPGPAYPQPTHQGPTYPHQQAPQGPAYPTQPTHAGYPTQPLPPQQYGAGGPGGYGPPPGGPGPAPRKARKGLIAAIVAGSLVTVGGVGAALAWQKLMPAGGQPDHVLPKNTLAYVRVDLDPSAGQKVAAYRLFDKLPKAKDALTSKDPKKAIFEQLKQQSKDLKDVDYANDVEPWLGDRMGLAVMAPDDGKTSPTVVLAVQVKDEGKAEASYAKLRDKAKNGSRTAAEDAHWFKDGYLIVTEKKSEQTVRSAIDAGTLDSREDYRGDMQALGDAGVASAWIDNKAAYDALRMSQPSLANATTDLPQGRTAATLRFDADYLELAALTRGANPKGSGAAVKDIANLPSDTAAVVSIAEPDALVRDAWPTVRKALSNTGARRDPVRQLEDQYGIKLPDDLQTLVGKQLDVVIQNQEISKKRAPGVTVRFTDDVPAAEAILGKLDDAGLTVAKERCGERLCLGSTKDAARLSNGDLGSSELFRKAVPGVDKAQAVAFVDLTKFQSLYVDSVPQDYRDFVRSIKAVGLSVTRDGDVVRQSLRVVAG